MNSFSANINTLSFRRFCCHGSLFLDVELVDIEFKASCAVVSFSGGSLVFAGDLVAGHTKENIVKIKYTGSLYLYSWKYIVSFRHWFVSTFH